MKSEKNHLIWAAGLFDGEGCVRVHKTLHKSKSFKGKCPTYSLNAFIKMVHKPAIKHLKKIFKMGQIGKMSPGKLNKRVCWRWNVSDNQAFEFLKKIYPFLIVKKKEAKIGISFINKCKRVKFNKRLGVTQKMLKRREYYFLKIQKAKNYEWKN